MQNDPSARIYNVVVELYQKPTRTCPLSIISRIRSRYCISSCFVGAAWPLPFVSALGTDEAVAGLVGIAESSGLSPASMLMISSDDAGYGRVRSE